MSPNVETTGAYAGTYPLLSAEELIAAATSKVPTNVQIIEIPPEWNHCTLWLRLRGANAGSAGTVGFYIEVSPCPLASVPVWMRYAVKNVTLNGTTTITDAATCVFGLDLEDQKGIRLGYVANGDASFGVYVQANLVRNI
jgi:hypothetical protein